LPDTAIVSIGHRSSLVQFHGRFFKLSPVRKGLHRLSEADKAASTVSIEAEEEDAPREPALPRA
jgi:putative ATP-binding cassette transporter